MSYERIQYEKKNGVALITLDYAPTLNAFDVTSSGEVLDALHVAEADDEVKVVVITGAGRAFSAGGDIGYMKAHVAEPDFAEKSMKPLAHNVSAIVLFLKQMSKLTIAAVNGACAGGGAGVAFGCDFIYAADNAKFIQAFVGIGLCPDTATTFTLPRMVGTHRAMEQFVTGRPVKAEEALATGMVNKIIPKDALLPVTLAFAEKLAKGPTLVYRNIKKLMYASMYKDLEAFLEPEAKYVSECSKSEDFAEGVTAFLEKRPAEFHGK